MKNQHSPISAVDSSSSSLPSASHDGAAKRQSKKKRPFTIYLAGDLWSHKDLTGNALLGDYIRKVSKGRYLCVLPQDLEEPVHRTVDIRNVDLKHVMMCDMAIFNFDGANLDCGTVVEFIYAKMIDIPCVLLRTDFRAAGEGGQDPWNLMASHWPRSKVVTMHGMKEYQQTKVAASLAQSIDRMYRKLAVEIVQALDVVRAEPPLVSDPRQMAAIYAWAIQCPGAGYADLFESGTVQNLLGDKASRKLLAAGN